MSILVAKQNHFQKILGNIGKGPEVAAVRCACMCSCANCGTCGCSCLCSWGKCNCRGHHDDNAVAESKMLMEFFEV